MPDELIFQQLAVSIKGKWVDEMRQNTQYRYEKLEFLHCRRLQERRLFWGILAER